MEQPSTPAATRSSMRGLAIVATVFALLGLSVPFTWSSSTQTLDEHSAAPFLEPVAAHAVGGASDDQAGAACMADAKAAADFTLPTTDGKSLTLSSLKGKVVLLNFWATWCGPCKAEIPALVELQNQYQDDLVVVGLSVDDSADKAKAFASQYKVNYPIVLGEGRDDIQDAYGPIYGIPASFVISRDGTVCKRHLGIAPKAQFEREIKGLL